MSKIIGFTGTRHGMTEKQRQGVRTLLLHLGATELHHGDCVGADAQADAIAVEIGIRRVAHPPSDSRLRAYCNADEIRSPKPYMARNRDIVVDGDELVAAPFEDEEQTRGGTWGTVRLARGSQVPFWVVHRDGTAHREWWMGEQT